MTDNEVVELVLHKDKEYFGILIERYQDKLTRYINRIIKLEPTEVDDVLQNIFIKTYQNLNSFDSKLKFSSWIYRIAHNETIDIYRKSRSKGKDTLIIVDEDTLRNISDDLADTSAKAEADITKKNIELALSKLSEKYREIIILRYFEHKDYDEISDILKKPPGTIATWLRRAKKQLAKEIIQKTL